MVKGSAKPSRQIVVDGETFRLTIEGPSYQLTWLTGPNPGYGFGGTLAGRQRCGTLGAARSAPHRHGPHRADPRVPAGDRPIDRLPTGLAKHCPGRRSRSVKPEHYGAMMRRYRIWMAWTIGPLTAALIVMRIHADPPHGQAESGGVTPLNQFSASLAPAPSLFPTARMPPRSSRCS